jgi:hypothetical protein
LAQLSSEKFIDLVLAGHELLETLFAQLETIAPRMVEALILFFIIARNTCFCNFSLQREWSGLGWRSALLHSHGRPNHFQGNRRLCYWGSANILTTYGW